MNTTRTHIITVSILGALALALLGAWIFLATKSNSLRAEALSTETKIIAKNHEGTYLNSVRTIFKNSKEDITIIDRQFIDKDGVPQFINLLESKSDQTGMKVDFGSIDITGGDATSNTLKIRMSGSGTWTQVINFLATLESLPYASRIESVSITKQDLKSSTWNFGLELIQYVQEKTK